MMNKVSAGWEDPPEWSGAAFHGAVLLDVLAVFVQRGRTDALEFTAATKRA